MCSVEYFEYLAKRCNLWHANKWASNRSAILRQLKFSMLEINKIQNGRKNNDPSNYIDYEARREDTTGITCRP